MNILVVDDQRAVADSIANGIAYKEIGIDEVYTAYSAMEARLVMLNFDIDILLTDIEMPEEDGLSLFRWMREKFPSTVGIFLTSHADFAYAREAIQMGGFDYILQPARYEDIKAVLERAVKEAHKKDREKRLEKASEIIEDQRDSLMELFMLKVTDGEYEEAKNLYDRMRNTFFANFEKPVFHPVLINILKYESKANKWNEGLIKLVFRNVLEELFEDFNLKVMLTKFDMQNYIAIAVTEANAIPVDAWCAGVENFTKFINTRMDFSVAVYPKKHELDEYSDESFNELKRRKNLNATGSPGIYWEVAPEDFGVVDNVERIRKAEDYIRANITNGITRTEVAEYVHLNEDYFTREFKKYTGYTYKDYEVMIRMEMAKTTLAKTKLPVSIVASKVGYDNFSHFSKAFKKYTGMTPQEFRKS
ncbi:MAG: helix-turn-helix domain-containing protein [Pseudobutyrivibrio ruminis]|nr:helix-turn-helix domain-containing protein [Pseudobutyrivibrio ruminis]